VDLWPLSQGEIDGQPDRFIDRAFDAPESISNANIEILSRPQIFERVVRGGLPEAVLSPSIADRNEFLRDYVRSLTAKDVRDLAALEHAGRLDRIIRLLAARTSTEVNLSDLASVLGIPLSTFRRYLPLFETTYVHHTIPAWSGNLTSKVVKRPKLAFVDSGAASTLLGTNAEALSRPTSTVSGQLFETFVAGELARQLTWSGTDARLYHWRDRAGHEVDLLLESADGRIVGIEVKAAVEVGSEATSGLRYLQSQLGDRFVAGFVVHCGERVMPAGDRLWTIPVSALWQW
jgi:uncharacterized protein